MPRRINRMRSKKKRNWKRRKNTKLPRALKPVSFKFKRSFQEIVDLQAIPTANWIPNVNGLYRQFVYKLEDLPGYGDFQNLFHSYKLTGVSVKFYFSNTSSSTMQSGDYLGNSQILMRIAPNPNGQVPVTLTENFFLETQSAKTRLCLNTTGRPLIVYSKLKQASNLYNADAVLPDYAMITPKWIATNEPQCSHYGLNCRLDRADGQGFTTGYSNHQFVRIIHTLYIETRQVQ